MKDTKTLSDYYDLKTAAAKLGVSYWTVHAAVVAGGLPFVRMGRSYRIPKKHIDGLPDAAISEFNRGGAQ